MYPGHKIFGHQAAIKSQVARTGNFWLFLDGCFAQEVPWTGNGEEIYSFADKPDDSTVHLIESAVSL